jgi:hypothetical protein
VQFIVVGADAVANVLPAIDGGIKQLVVSYIEQCVVLSVTFLACSFCGHRHKSEAYRWRCVASLYVACGVVAHQYSDHIVTVRESVCIASDLVSGLPYLTAFLTTLQNS